MFYCPACRRPQVEVKMTCRHCKAYMFPQQVFERPHPPWGAIFLVVLVIVGLLLAGNHVMRTSGQANLMQAMSHELEKTTNWKPIKDFARSVNAAVASTAKITKRPGRAAGG